MSNVVLIITTVASGLLAGVYFAFSASVMLAMREVDDRAFVQVMQGINRRILNAAFLAVFLVAPIGSVAAAVLELTGGAARWSVLAGAVLTVAAALITIGVNVPLNNALDAAGSTDDRATRAAFEDRWVRANHLRTAISAVGLAFYCAGL